MACIATQHRLPNQPLAIVKQNFRHARYQADGHRFRQKKQQLRPKMRILSLYYVRKLCQLSRRQERLGNLPSEQGKSFDSDPDVSEPGFVQQGRQIESSFECVNLP